MDGAWKPEGDEIAVGVVDHGTTASERFAATVDSLRDDLAADTVVVTGSIEDVLAADPTLLVAAGEAALSRIARCECPVPVLPAGDVDGIESVSLERLPDAVRAALSGSARIRSRSVLGVAFDGKTRRALFDVTLVTEEPARISEYSVHSRSERVASFRADGVVVATPAGTEGYASAVDAPALSPALEAVAVAPISPFATRTRRWVLPEDGIELAVERDEGAVGLVVDGRSVATVPVDSPVRLDVDGTLRTLILPSEFRQ
jgi:NAD+ kinase